MKIKELLEKVAEPKLHEKRKKNEQLVENFLAPKETLNDFLLENVNKIFEQEFNDWKINKLIAEDIEQSGEKVIRFPKIKITENWGKVGNEDRELLETLMRKVKGETVEAKIKSVEAFIEYQPNLPIPNILSNLMFLEIFSCIIDEYSYQTAGFLFEAFLAGLFGGIQIDDPSQVGAAPGSLPIEDVRLAVREKDEVSSKIVPYSLKVLSPTTDLKGSFTNLVDYFADQTPGRNNESIVYLVVTKKGQGTLSFHEFAITADSWFNWIGYEEHKDIDIVEQLPADISGPELMSLFQLEPYNNKKYPTVIAKVKSRSELTEFFDTYLAPKIAAEHGIDQESIKLQKVMGTEIGGEQVDGGLKGFLVREDMNYNFEFSIGSEYQTTGHMSTQAKHLYTPEQYAATNQELAVSQESGNYHNFWESMKNTKGYITSQQFSIAPKYFRDKSKSKHLGEIDLYKKRLVDLGNKYAQDLTAELINIYNALDSLSNNINRYFLSDDGSNKQYGREAVHDSKMLYNNTKKAVMKQTEDG